jgi:hypothetical protein
MRAWWWSIALGMVACSGDDGTDGSNTQLQDDDDDDDVGDDDDDVPGGTGLPDVYDLMRDDPNYCESQPAYEPSVPTSSSHWFSELSYDANGVVSGYELVEMYPNERFRESGITDCVIVWEVSGEVDEPVVGGTDIGLAVSLVLDLVETTCEPNPFEEETNLTTHYNVALTGESTRWFFDSGTEFAAGYGDEDYLSWFYDDCKLF